jgi:hypothetical protein
MKNKHFATALIALFMLASVSMGMRGQLVRRYLCSSLQAVAGDAQPMDSPYVASDPRPEDGSLHDNSWATLSWAPGTGAASHDVYLGTSYDDVAAGTGSTFQGNQTATFFIVGFPGYPYPDGLSYGTTYYWRVDEIEAGGSTKHVGNVWSFSVPPYKAYDPSPADGSTSVDPANVQLAWSPGNRAILHTVYIGDDYDTVADAPRDTGATVGTSFYDPGVLEHGQTYYWRIDESGSAGKEYYKGDVWSFTTTYAPLTSLEITGPTEIFELTSSQYTAIAHYEGGSTKTVTNSATWWLEETPHATLSSTGLLTCKNLDAPAILALHAEFTENEVTVEATKLVSCVPINDVYYVDTRTGRDHYDGLSPDQAFETIQHAIDTAQDGDMILVYPGVYQEEINFQGKAIMVRSAEDAAVLEAPDAFAVSFYMNEGTNSILKNFVVRNSYMGIFVAHSSPSIVNVTIVNNRFGLEAYADAHPNVSNCIFWNNTGGDLFGSQARYSCLADPDLHIRSFHVDPLFVDPEGGDYHLLSERGRYWPEHDIRVLDGVTSPCIDAGDPNAPLSGEPTPNGALVNIGAHGGTPYASMSEVRTNPRDINRDGWVNLLDLAMFADGWLLYDPPVPNQLPASVIVASPSDGARFQCPIKSVDLEAYAFDPDGAIVEVRFYVNGRYYAQDIDGRDGWKAILTNFSATYYQITAEAVDRYGATITSLPVNITVCGPRG